jgi:hypothetical protein
MTDQATSPLRRRMIEDMTLDRLTRSVAFLSRLLEAGVDVRFAEEKDHHAPPAHTPHAPPQSELVQKCRRCSTPQI